jgi:hypothetical protein
MARYYSGQNQPLGSWNNLPIYLTTILTGALVAGLIVSAVLMSMNSILLNAFIFVMPIRPAWSVWRVLSYPFIDRVDFFTPFNIVCFYWFSVGIETHLGRIKLTQLLLLLILTPVVFSICLYLGLGFSTGLMGAMLPVAGLLVAFATLYPGTEAWGWIPFKWFAFACIFCGSLMMMAGRDWLGLARLWLVCAVGFAYMRYAKEQEYDDYESPLAGVKKLFQRKPKFRVVPSPSTQSYRAVDEPPSELDTLLDKIAKSGMDSLTPKEKAQLQKARDALMRKDQH